MKTASEIQEDVYRLLRGSSLADMLSGTVYLDEENRPRDSRLEDAVVIHTAGVPGQIQEGYVSVLIFLPDIDPWQNGVLVKDYARAKALEAAAQQWADSIRGAHEGYLFELSGTISTQAEPSIGQHFVAVRLRYRYAEN